MKSYNNKKMNIIETEELERILKKELMDLINEPYVESLKRERYRRLEPLIREYQNRKNDKTKNKSNIMEIYEKQRKELSNNSVYQKLSQKENFTKNKKAISEYEKQMAFSETHHLIKEIANTNTDSKKIQQVQKKGFFSKFFDLFRKKKSIKETAKKDEVVKITKPKVKNECRRYTYAQKNKKDYICNEFEKALRNFQNYSKENPNYMRIKNGRVVKYEPRYL